MEWIYYVYVFKFWFMILKFTKYMVSVHCPVHTSVHELGCINVIGQSSQFKGHFPISFYLFFLQKLFEVVLNQTAEGPTNASSSWFTYQTSVP